MLTKFIVAGLIPGMMAKPIVPRQGANVERRELENRDYYTKPKPLVQTAIFPLPSLGPSTFPFTTPSTLPTLPLTTPSLPLTTPTLTTPTLTTPTLPLTTPTLPLTTPTLPLTTPSTLPLTTPSTLLTTPSTLLTTPSTLLTTPSTLPLTTPSTLPLTTPSVSPSLPGSPISKQATAALVTPVSTFPVAPPPRIQSVAAAQYAVAAPAVYPTASPFKATPSAVVEIQHEVESTPVVPVVAPSLPPSYPVKNDYTVKSPLPLTTPVTLPPVVQVPQPHYAVAKQPPVESHVVPPVTHEYGVHEYASAPPPVVSHVAPPAYGVHEYASAPPPVVSHVAPSLPVYGVEEKPASVAAAQVTPSLPLEPPYAVDAYAKPMITPDPAGPSGKNECVTKCHPECKPGDSQCMAACLQKCHAAKMLGSTGITGNAGKLLNNNAVAHDDPTANAKVAGKPVSGPPALSAGAGFKSFEACMKSCKNKFQYADIAFPISQGKSDCAEACAAYSSEGAGLTAKREAEDKRAVEPVLGALRPAAPALTTEAGYASFEACMEDCHSRFQSANIAFEISQGKGGCKKACAKYEKNGSGVTVARAVEPSLGGLRPAGPEFVAGAGYASLEACMKDCHGRWQSANIVFDIDQGRKNCKKACAAYESNGSGVIVKKEVDATPAVKKATRAFPFEGNGPLNKDPTPKEGPFSKTPETVAGASTSSYDACMHGCSTKLQSADIAFEVDQGDANCATKCAKYSSNGVGVTHL